MTYLFIDDIRVPYITEDGYSEFEMDDVIGYVSAYQYTYFEPFKTEKWNIVRNYNDFVNFVEMNAFPDFVAFDHDLSDQHYEYTTMESYDRYTEKTGYDCAKWLCNYCQENNLKFPDYIVHSLNPVGKENIETYITNYKKHCEVDE